MIHILSPIVVGSIVGLLARPVVPVMQHYNLFATVLLGVLGLLLGGLLARIFSEGKEEPAFRPTSLLMAIVRGVAVLVVLGLLH